MFIIGAAIAAIVAYSLISISGLWQQGFMERLLSGKVDRREERLPVWAEGATGQFRGEREIEIELPKGRIISRIMMRIRVPFTIGAADCTALQPHGMQRVLRKAVLEVQRGRGAPKVYGGDIQVWSPRGVNDAAGGRTASFAGIALSRNYLLNNGTTPPQTDPGLTVVGSPNIGEITYELNFLTKNRSFPYRELLDTTKITRAALRLTIGVLETTAAGDDTDVYVTAAGSTVACTLDVVTTLETLVNIGSWPFDIRVVRSISDGLAVSNQQHVDIGENAYYSRLQMHVLDNDVDSDARVDEVSFVVDNKDYIVNRKRWLDLQQRNKGQYNIEAWPAGYAVIDFDQERMGTFQDVWGEHDARLELNNPAGAVVTADFMHTIVEEIKGHPNRNS